MTTMIFVYGTLRKGQYNNGYLRDSKYIGEAILAGYKMVDLGSYPAIYRTDDDQDIVFGELYEVDKEILDRIDWMEKSAGYQANTMTKQYVRVYEIAKERAENYVLVENGDWVKYDKAKSH